jgi:uncharacterized membrane-anchored protein YhcB (DUF1043 family)
MEHAPDGWFYYAVTLAFGGALIWVIIRYTGKIDSTLTKIQETLQDLKTITSVHTHKFDAQGQRLDDHDDEIDDLKKKVFPINYRK